MQTFEAFVRDDTERLADEAEDELAAVQARLFGAVIKLATVADALAEVALDDVGVAAAIRRYLASARLRRLAASRRLHNGAWDVPAQAPLPLGRLAEMEAGTRGYARELQALASAPPRR